MSAAPPRGGLTKALGATKMLSLAQAQSLVEARICGLPDDPIEVVVLTSDTLEKSFGWVFFYQSRVYIQSEDPSDALVGNAPVIVNRFTGDVVATGTAESIDAYISRYKASLSPGGA
ncbi:MAG: YrhB domain-containing protein [Pseudomonadota bacterium]